MRLLRLLAGTALLLGGAAAHAQSMVPPQPRGVDFTRWEGRWYEVARLPNWPQRHCGPEVVATLLRRSDGDISVVHQCRTTDGLFGPVWGVSLSRGTVEEPIAAGTLGVRFSPDWVTLPPFAWNSYYALALNVDARYALLGSLDRERLWILSQTRTIDEGTYQRAVAEAARLGYDTAALIRPGK
jgi:apolipoprotein D and lipocalin family protein